VAINTSHGTNGMKLRSPVQVSNNAPIKPPSTLGTKSSHNQLRSNTPLKWLRVRQTAVGYAKNRATALVASAVTGGTTSISKGNVINPPPPASALIVPARMVARKNKISVCIRVCYSLPCFWLTAADLPRPERFGLPLRVPRQRIEIDIAASQNDTDAFSPGLDFVFDNRRIRNRR
jgi:hypothetical protein